MKKIILYDDSIKYDKLLLGSLHENIQKYHVKEYTNTIEIFNKINFNSIEYLGMLFHYQGNYIIPFFYNYFNEDKKNDNNIQNIVKSPEHFIFNSKYLSFSNLFVSFLKKIRYIRGASFIVDILSCNFNCEEFKKDAENLEKELDIIIRYSIDQKGNSSNGNWVMESHNINVKELYFTEKINKWNNVLNNEINVKNIINIKTNNNVNIFSVSTNGNYTVYNLLQDITWDNLLIGVNASTNFIRLDASNVIFDGKGHIITIPSGITYSGLFIPSIRNNNKDNPIIIRNLQINNNSNLANVAGGIIRTTLFNRCVFNIENCSYHQMKGTWSNFAGGITGAFSGASSGICKILNCYSTGNITGRNCGGITGAFAGENKGVCIIRNCYSSGNIIGEYSGGISGVSSGNKDGTCIILNCYSIGNILGNFAGGITGAFTGEDNGNCVIQNCYSIGNYIFGSNSGGIVGSNAGNFSGNSIIQNCYTNSIISGNFAGGITGSSPGENNGSCIIQNCFSIKEITGFNSGGITGFNSGSFEGNCIIQNCYSRGSIIGNNPQSYTSGFANGNFDINDISFGLVNNLINNSILQNGSTNTTILDNSYGVVRIGMSNTQYYSEVRNIDTLGINGFITTFNNFPRLQAFHHIPWDSNTYEKHDISSNFINDLSQLIIQSDIETSGNTFLNKQNVKNYYGLLTNIITNNILITKVLQQGNATKNNVIYLLIDNNDVIDIDNIDVENTAILIDSINMDIIQFNYNLDNVLNKIKYDPNNNKLEINNIVYEYNDSPKTKFFLKSIIFTIIAQGSLVIEGRNLSIVENVKLIIRPTKVIISFDKYIEFNVKNVILTDELSNFNVTNISNIGFTINNLIPNTTYNGGFKLINDNAETKKIDISFTTLPVIDVKLMLFL